MGSKIYKTQHREVNSNTLLPSSRQSLVFLKVLISFPVVVFVVVCLFFKKILLRKRKNKIDQ